MLTDHENNTSILAANAKKQPKSVFSPLKAHIHSIDNCNIVGNDCILVQTETQLIKWCMVFKRMAQMCSRWAGAQTCRLTGIVIILKTHKHIMVKQTHTNPEY